MPGGSTATADLVIRGSWGSNLSRGGVSVTAVRRFLGARLTEADCVLLSLFSFLTYIAVFE